MNEVVSAENVAAEHVSAETSAADQALFHGRRIVRTDAELACPLIDATLREAGAQLTLLPDATPADAVLEALRDAELVLMCYTPITAAMIAVATSLKGIVKYGVGIDAIDIDTAIAHGVPVVNIPAYAEQTVAEGAVALLMSLMRKLHPLNEALHRDGWAWPEAVWRGSDIAGKTVGLVGTGRIGRHMARILGGGFGARVLGYDPFVSAETMASQGIGHREDLHALLAESDIVSLHTVLSPETESLIGATEFAAMRRRPWFVNVSRGALVDEAALVVALDSGQIRGAALDVFRHEPLNRDDHPLATLFGRDNVILSPHLTFFTDEAMTRLEAETLQRCREILAGEDVLVLSEDARLRRQRRGVRFR